MKRMIHIDLFSGIGGFSYAADQVWQNMEHIFCDNNAFARAVTQKHWMGAKHYEDIRKLIADTENSQPEGLRLEREPQSKDPKVGDYYLVTGGFPCQPFSQAGRRRGTADDRYLWPEMFRIIQLAKPTWVIAENVRGLATWNDGMVLEKVCTDLESENYEVQPFIIPAVAVNAPHRRDRLWIIAHNTNNTGGNGNRRSVHSLSAEQKEQRLFEQTNSGGNAPYSESQRSRGSSSKECTIQERIMEQDKQKGSAVWSQGKGRVGNDTDSTDPRLERCREKGSRLSGQSDRAWGNKGPDWSKDWIEIATRLCRMDDGIPKRMDRLKSLGNAIVPQVAIQIMKSMKESI